MVANTNLPKKLPTAQEVMEKLALAEAEKASVEARKHAAAEAEKKALIDKITKPSGVSDEEALRRVAIIIDRAVANGSVAPKAGELLIAGVTDVLDIYASATG